MVTLHSLLEIDWNDGINGLKRDSVESYNLNSFENV